MDSILELKNIETGYGKRQVLWGVNESIRKGEKILLIGPNGSGKSTLLSAIIGILPLMKGEIFLKGEKINHWDVEERVSYGISYLRQSENIFPNLKVKENFELSACSKNGKLLKERLKWVLSLFPFLEGKLDKRGGILSGGERQALAIGMVLMKKSEILLLDEPTAGLSPKAAKEILNGIEKAQMEEDFTILLVEHNFGLVSSWVTRVIGMSEGKIVMRENEVASLFKEKDKLEMLYFGQGSRVKSEK